MGLNDLVKKDPYDLTNIKDIIMSTQGSEWFTVVDLKESFYVFKLKKWTKIKLLLNLLRWCMNRILWL